MKKRLIIITSVLVALLMALAVFPVLAADETGTYTVALDTSGLTDTGGEFSVTVSVNNSTDMSGFQFVLPYDSEKVSVKSIFIYENVLNASVGGKNDTSDTPENLFYDTGSEVRFISVSTANTYKDAGITELFIVNFEVKTGQTVAAADIAAGTNPIINLDPNAETRTFKTLAAKVTGTAGAVTVDAVDMVTKLKGSNKLTFEVTSNNPKQELKAELMKGETVIKTVTLPAATEGSGSVTQTVTFEDIPADTYDLVISKATHLSYTITGVVVGVNQEINFSNSTSNYLNNIELLYGDINNDMLINSDDVAIIREEGNYFKHVTDLGVNSTCDLNGDGLVNSDDVAIIRYEKYYFKNAIYDSTFEY